MKQIIWKSALWLTVIRAVAVFGYAQEAGRPNKKTDDVHKAIENAESKFSELFEKGDIRGLAELYDEGARLMPPNSSALGGRAAIYNFWKAARNAGVQKVGMRTLETGGTGGDTTYETGTYTLYGASGDVIDDGNYVVVWKRDGKSWLLYRDIWNSSNRK